MRIHFERDGITFEYERSPMPEHRFRSLCLLAAGGLYVGLMIGVIKLCGCLGLLILAAATVLSIMAAVEF